MITRDAQSTLVRLSTQFEAIALTGPGKVVNQHSPEWLFLTRNTFHLKIKIHGNKSKEISGGFFITFQMGQL